MRKIVLNCSIGGFGLSPLATKKLMERKGKKLNDFDFNELRNDPDLIAIVEELKDKADAPYSNLVIEEYDDKNFTYHIDNYDGFESLRLEPVVSEKILDECKNTREVINYLKSLNINVKERTKQNRRKRLFSKIYWIGLIILDIVLFAELLTTKFPELFTPTETTVVDMNEVVSFEANGNLLYLRLSDGTGYYYEYDPEEIETVECSIINQKYCDDGTKLLVEMPNGEAHVYHTETTVGADAKTVYFSVTTENIDDYTKYEIVDFE